MSTDKEYPNKRTASGSRARQKIFHCPSCGAELDCSVCDKSLIFKNWLRELSTDLYPSDVDLIVWRYYGNKLYPVGVLELTVNDREKSPSIFWRKILTRYYDGMQAQSSEAVARALKTRAYLIVFHQGLKAFRVYTFHKKTWTTMLNIEQMENFLNGLPYK